MGVDAAGQGGGADDALIVEMLELMAARALLRKALRGPAIRLLPDAPDASRRETSPAAAVLMRELGDFAEFDERGNVVFILN